MKGLKIAALVTTAGALLVVPTVGQADKPNAQGQHNHPNAKGNNPNAKGKSDNNRCKKPTVNKGFVVKGTLVSYTADNASTANVNEAVVAMTVTRANRHARRAGVDKGDAYSADGTPGTPPGNDAFAVRLSDFSGTDTPSAGDKVRVAGKIEVTRKKCAPSGAQVADRYGDVDIRRVKIIDQDPDA